MERFLTKSILSKRTSADHEQVQVVGLEPQKKKQKDDTQTERTVRPQDVQVQCSSSDTGKQQTESIHEVYDDNVGISSDNIPQYARDVEHLPVESDYQDAEDIDSERVVADSNSTTKDTPVICKGPSGKFP